jgi:ubiquinone/menaquinone biosynthesis C-methylase UbiE
MHFCRPAADEERRKWQNPEAILAEIGLRPGLTFADLGCGGGFFTLPAARVVGRRGKVYGLDVDAESIASLKKAAAGEGLKNLDLTVGKAEGMVVCPQCADIVFLGIVLHDFQDPARVLENARRTVKPDGILVDLDWDKKPMELGPAIKIRFSREKASRLIRAAGFTVETVKDNGLYHYLIIARPG